MKPSTEDEIEGKFHDLKGKVKKKAGQLTNDPDLEAEGKAEDIRIVFEQRGIDVDDKSRKLIGSRTNLGTLNGWLRRAFKVDNASDLFAE